MNNNSKGVHIFADYKGLIGCEYELGEFVYSLMEEAILTRSQMKIVHKNLVILNTETQERETEPGFTAILQLDSSHFTAHSYTTEEQLGLLCLDIFTCGANEGDTQAVLDYVEQSIQNQYPNFTRVSCHIVKRFLF